MTDPEITVSDAPERSRYEVFVDGERAGFAVYRDEARTRVFTHTEIAGEYEGRGVGSALAREALDDARATGRPVVPRCPFIARYIERHTEYADLLAQS